MQLSFEYTQNIGAGEQPAAYHSPDNVVQVFFVDGGQIYIKDADTPQGAWENRVFGAQYLGSGDTNVQYLRIRYAPGTNIYVMWESEDRHRLAVWSMIQDASNYLMNGSMEFLLDDPNVSLSLVLANPGGIFADEEEALAVPGARINLFFRAGDSSRFPMGAYFIDRAPFSVKEATISIDARNVTGKLLKEQTFDESRQYASDTITNVLKAILDTAAVTAYRVESSGETLGATFPHNKTVWDGIKDVLTTVRGWRVEERYDGVIVIGSSSYHEFTPRTTYSFSRGEDCFSRAITRDDKDVWSRVCVHTRDFTVAEFKTVEFIGGWNLPQQKTLYAEVPDGTTALQAQSYAEELAERVGAVGIVETFVGPFRPHLIPGDAAEILTPASSLLGVVTNVRHTFGRSGFTTEFTVDSGGVLGKPKIRDFIEEIAGRAQIQASQFV